MEPRERVYHFGAGAEEPAADSRGPNRGLGVSVGFQDGHLMTVAKAFEQARTDAKLPIEIKLYSAHHTFATNLMTATGNLPLVMRTLGHTNAQTAMIYQHPSMEDVREVVNARPLSPAPKPGPVLVRHNSRHTTGS
jgi:integrase